MTFWLEITETEMSDLELLIERWSDPSYAQNVAEQRIMKTLGPIIYSVKSCTRVTPSDVVPEAVVFVPTYPDIDDIVEDVSVLVTPENYRAGTTYTTIDETETEIMYMINGSALSEEERNDWLSTGVLPWQ